MKTISVIIPAYNEEKRLGGTLLKWQSFLKTSNSKYKIIEIIVVDDGSYDKTNETAESFKNYLPVKIIKIEQNKGKGNAVKAGVKKALGDLVFIYDADAAVLPNEVDRLFLEINNADIVIGSRIVNGAKAQISIFRRFVGRCFHLLCVPLLPGIKDASCGAKLFRTATANKVFDLQKLNRFAFDIEILWLAKKLNFRIKEVGVTWQEISGSKVNILRDSFEMFVSVLSLYKRQIFS